jgi:hypothetical protein
MQTQNVIDPSDLIPVDLVPDEYPHLFNRKQFSWMLRCRDRNGLEHAIVKMGERRLFLSRHRFSEWLANQAEDGERNA